MSKRGNPIQEAGKRTVISQSVVAPDGNASNTDKGNPAKMRVPAGKRTTISQKVGNPSASKK